MVSQLRVVILKPSKYAVDGDVERFRWWFMPNSVDASEMLETSFRFLQSRQCHTASVLQCGKLMGLVTMGNVGEFLVIQTGAILKCV